MEVIGFILIGVLVIVAFVVTKIGAKTNMSDEERKKALVAFYSQPVYDVDDEEDEKDDIYFDPAYSYVPGNIAYDDNDDDDEWLARND